MTNIVVCGVLLFLLYQCVTAGDSCREYSQFTCKEIEEAYYNVWFTFPEDEKPYNLGGTKGLKSCGQIAYDYAEEKRVQNLNWNYVCCMITETSSCYEKHR